MVLPETTARFWRAPCASYQLVYVSRLEIFERKNLSERGTDTTPNNRQVQPHNVSISPFLEVAPTEHGSDSPCRTRINPPRKGGGQSRMGLSCSPYHPGRRVEAPATRAESQEFLACGKIGYRDEVATPIAIFVCKRVSSFVEIPERYGCKQLQCTELRRY